MIERDVTLQGQPVRLALFGPDSVLFSADEIRVNGVEYRLRCYLVRADWGWRIESSHVGLDRGDWRKDPTDKAMSTLANEMRDMLADVIGNDAALMRAAQIDKLMADRQRALAEQADHERKAREAGAKATRLYNEAQIAASA